ncbi:hypothetical protein [Bradyrhizobium neotropicale]|nr:hypothetical protein [Bradyrhizobium neotropicale]
MASLEFRELSVQLGGGAILLPANAGNKNIPLRRDPDLDASRQARVH